MLCSSSTARLVEGAAKLGPVEYVVIKGVDGPVSARRLLAVESGRMVVGRNEGAMVGRDADLGRLHGIFDTGRSHLVGVVGAAGLGKSRLIGEFSAMAARRGARCYWPGVRLTPPRWRFVRCRDCCARCSAWTASVMPTPERTHWLNAVGG